MENFFSRTCSGHSKGSWCGMQFRPLCLTTGVTATERCIEAVLLHKTMYW